MCDDLPGYQAPHPPWDESWPAQRRRLLHAALDATAASHAGRPPTVVAEVLRRELDARGLDGWLAGSPAMLTAVEEIAARRG